MGTAASSRNLQHGYPSPGPQSPAGQRVMDHVFFLSNTEWKRAREESAYDLIIVGSGFCAYAVAARALERNPFARLLIVERGSFFLPEHFQNLPLPFVQTLGGMSETFPWTLRSSTATGADGVVRWQHGMVPFFGGRSTLWSAWCPVPEGEELRGWPRATVLAAQRNFAAAKELLRVKSVATVDMREIDGQLDSAHHEARKRLVKTRRPIYGKLQRRVQELLAGARGRAGVYRIEPAPLASDGERDGVDFQKFAVPGALLQLVVDSRARRDRGEGAALEIVTDCVVTRIGNQAGRATHLETSRGVLPIGEAKLVLAMGTLPPTTLVRNSFPELTRLGERFSAHFITSIVARVPRRSIAPEHGGAGGQGDGLGELEVGACYIAGAVEGDFGKQFHIQLSVLSDRDPARNAATALRYMPDVVATASSAQLLSSKDHVVMVCAALGQLDHDNDDTWFRHNVQDGDLTTNSLLRVRSDGDKDGRTWDGMDDATFRILEEVLSPGGRRELEYWDNEGERWVSERPSAAARRVDALVHESSTMHIGEEEDAPVDLDYRVRGTTNVYMTGGALWPEGGSWNPTLMMVALGLDLADRLVPAGDGPGVGTAKYWIDRLSLRRSSLGGFFAPTCASGEVVLAVALPERIRGDRRLHSANYYLIEAGAPSALHRLNQDELWYFHAGGAARLHVFDDAGGEYREITLGADTDAGQVMQAAAPWGRWFGVEVASGGFVLVSCSLAPGWDPRDSTLPSRGDVDRLASLYSGQAGLIRRLAAVVVEV